MARPKPSAQGELLTHRDEIHNHKHCIKYHKIDNNSLTMPPIREEINYYKWWLWLWWWWRWRLDLELWRWQMAFFLFVSSFSRLPVSHREEPLYIWVPSRKLFRLTIRWRRQLYGRTKMVPPYSCPLSSYTSPFESRFLGVFWNLVSLTLMLWFPFPSIVSCAGKNRKIGLHIPLIISH